MPPLILNTPDPMVKVRVMATRDDSTKALKALHAAGVLHVEESKELKPVDKEAIDRERRKVGELLTCINDVLAYAPKGEKVSLGDDVEVIYARPLDEIDSDVRALCNRLSNMHQRATKLAQEAQEAAELARYLGSLAQLADTRLRDLGFSGDYLFSRVYVFPSETFEAPYARLRDHLLESVVAKTEDEDHPVCNCQDRTARDDRLYGQG
jgi:vacuolar-type H+-ATPase subunit I/STV1